MNRHSRPFLHLGPTLSEDAPHVVREGIARRRLVVTTGQCPCGARMPRPSRAQRRQMCRQGGVWEATVSHEIDCPAVHPATVRWAGSR